MIRNFTASRRNGHLPRPVQPQLGATQVAQFVQAEISRNNLYLTFAQEQISKDRDFYKYLVTCAAVIAAVLGIFSYASLRDFRLDLKDQGVQSLDSFKRAAQNELDKSVDKIRDEVTARIDHEFKKDVISDIISDQVAKKTDNFLDANIRNETISQVDNAIRKERPVILDTVKKTAREEVISMRKVIGDAATDAVKREVELVVSPVRSEMDKLKESARLQYLLIRADTMDTATMEELYDYVSGAKLSNYDSAEKLRIARALSGIGYNIDMHFDPYVRISPPTDKKPTKDTIANGRYSSERMEALRAYPVTSEDYIEVLIGVIQNDDHVLAVRFAIDRLNEATKSNFIVGDRREILRLWGAGMIKKAQ